MGVFPTCEVAVELPRERHRGDSWGEPRREPETRKVAGVLPQPGGTDDLEASRPEGTRVAMTFHWPKSDHASLKGCFVLYGGSRYRVVGDPQPYAFSPLSFDRAVEAELVDG